MPSTDRHLTRGASCALVVMLLLGACTADRPDAGATPPSATAAPVTETVPTALADGSALPELPDHLTASKPLVGTGKLGDPDGLVEVCLGLLAPETGTYLDTHLGPLGASVVFEAAGPDRRIVACDALYRPEAGFEPCAVVTSRWPDDETLEQAGGGLSMSCPQDAALVTAFLWVTAPAEAAWVLHEQDTHHVAYPVSAGRPVRVAAAVDLSATASTYEARVQFVDPDGRRIGSKEVGGAGAG